MARTLTVVGLLVLLVLVAVWALQRRLIFLPAGAPASVESVLPGAETVVLTTSDGLDLAAWYLPSGDALVVVFPGNAGNRAARAPLARALADRGVSVLLVEYRGYGGNPGRPTEEGLRRDAEAAVAWADVHHVGGPRIVLGESLGAGPATWAATISRPDGLVLRSPFPTLAAVAREHYGPVPLSLLRDRFDVEGTVATIEAPTVVVVGDADRIVPPELSRRVHDAAAGPTRWVVVTGAGHNDAALVHGVAVIDAVDGLVTELEGGSDATE